MQSVCSHILHGPVAQERDWSCLSPVSSELDVLCLEALCEKCSLFSRR